MVDDIFYDNSGILFFILDFLLLFYDNRSIGILARKFAAMPEAELTKALLFILVFLILFYKGI
ncbi:MAG: hypothetical protein Q8920_02680 [Bacillota bacterium]|nr:hypothetical protein [Bacillota bacterium]